MQTGKSRSLECEFLSAFSSWVAKKLTQRLSGVHCSDSGKAAECVGSEELHRYRSHPSGPSLPSVRVERSSLFLEESWISASTKRKSASILCESKRVSIKNDH